MEKDKENGAGIAAMLIFVAAVVACVILVFVAIGYLLGQFLL